MLFLEKIAQRDDIAEEDKNRIEGAIFVGISKTDASEMISSFALKRGA